MIIKALSCHHPWALLIADGRKPIETRTWPTRYRGELLLCATGARRDVITYCTFFKLCPEDFDRCMRTLGHALAVVTLADCRPMTEADEPDAYCECTPGRFAWVLTDVRRIKPFPVKGHHRIWNIDVAPERLLPITEPA